MSITELRTRIYPTEGKAYCNKCAVFLDNGQPKNPNLTYLPKEEFDKIQDHKADDSVLSVFTVDQILAILLALKDDSVEKSVEYFKDQKDKTDATVKFYGEMIQTGLYQKYVTSENTAIQKYQALHQCNNPSCKLEVNLPRDYPYVDHSVGRMVRSPEELQHPDDVIRNVMKKHTGSTVNSNFIDANDKKDEKEKKEQE
jgi:hypothetical protein